MLILIIQPVTVMPQFLASAQKGQVTYYVEAQPYTVYCLTCLAFDLTLKLQYIDYTLLKGTKNA